MAKNNRATDSDQVEEEASVYPKKRWLNSGRFTPQQRDVLSAALADGKAYTYEETVKTMQTFLNTEVL